MFGVYVRNSAWWTSELGFYIRLVSCFQGFRAGSFSKQRHVIFHFVDRTSLYNLINRTNLVKNFLNMFIAFLYMFRATMCPSSGEICDTWYYKIKVKCTLVQALRLSTGRTAHRESRDIALPFHDHGTRRRWWVSVTPRPPFTPEIDPVPIVQEAGWAPGSIWTGAENLAPTGIRSPDRSARNQSLYRLRYPAHTPDIGHSILLTV